MYLRTLLFLGISASIIFIAVLGTSLVVISAKHEKLFMQDIIVDKFSTAVHELNLLVSDFRLYKNERTESQWQSRYNALQALIAQQRPYLSGNKMTLLLRDIYKLQNQFQEIIKIHSQQNAAADREENSHQQQAFIEQLQVNTQIISSTAKQLTIVAHEQLEDIITQAKHLIILLLSVVVLMMVAIWFTFSRRFFTPMKTVRNDIKAFSEDRTYRMSIQRNDEFGELASAFNTMADKLQDCMAAEQLLSHQTDYDALTGLPNRLLFVDRLNQSVKLSERNQSKIAVLGINIDQFKELNDSLGQKVADEVLIHITQRLMKCMRETDSVSRVGEDEFMVILDAIMDGQMIADIVKKIMHIALEPIQVFEHTLKVTFSLGISVYPDDANNSERLIQNADEAMSIAKSGGRNTCRYFNSSF